MYYSLFPASFRLPPEWADVTLLALWTFALMLTAMVTLQWLRYRRRIRHAFPHHLDSLEARYPRLPMMEPLLGAIALLLCPLAALTLGRPGTWQAAILIAFLLGLVVHRHFNFVAGLAATTLAGIGFLGLPLAMATVLAGPESAEKITRQQELLIGGLSSLILALVWAVCAGQWAKQHVRGVAISTAYKITWPALIQAIAGLLVAALCLAPAFQRG